MSIVSRAGTPRNGCYRRKAQQAAESILTAFQTGNLPKALAGKEVPHATL